MPATQTASTAPDLTTMTVVNLRKYAKDNGITVPSNSNKGALIAAIESATPPKAAKPADTPKAAKPAKASPVRTDLTPADVKPDNSARIAELVANAEEYIAAGVTSAMALARTLYELYPFKPWIAAKSDVKQYFAAMGIDGDNYKLPSKARKELSRLMFTRDVNTSAQHIAWMSGAGEKTVKSDKSELGFVDAERSATQQANAARRNTPAVTPPAAPREPVTQMTPVYSMTGVREFIAKLDDADMVQELADLCVERMTAMGFTVTLDVAESE